MAKENVLWEMMVDILGEKDSFKELRDLGRKWDASCTQDDMKHALWCISDLKKTIHSEPYLTEYAFYNDVTIEFEEMLDKIAENMTTLLNQQGQTPQQKPEDEHEM